MVLMLGAEIAQPQLLEMMGISKSFGRTQVLREVAFDLRLGEVHALLGENGAGKSTLMKILSGAGTPDHGVIRLGGQEVQIGSVTEAQKLGVLMVYQELALVPDLSVAENLFLGQLSPIVNHRQLYARAQPLLDEVELNVNPAQTISSLSIGERQLVEIARALAREGRVLILDEPTAALSAGETKQLFRMIHKVQARGVGVVYISHRLGEVFEIADRVTVLRDGERVGQHAVSEVTPEQIIEEMVGKSLKNYARVSSATRVQLGKFSFEADGVAAGSVALHKGEIVGLAGVIGSGRNRILSILYGLDGHAAWEDETIRSPRDAIARGMVFVPEDRKAQGLVLGLSVRENLSLATLTELSRLGFMQPRAERKQTNAWIKRLSLRPPTPEKIVWELSGGNQQKVVVGKALATGPKVLLMDEPTRGVDVGSRTELYNVIDALAKDGLGLVLSSSDTEELISLCDRLLIFRDGRVVKTLHAPFAREEVVGYVTGAIGLA